MSILQEILRHLKHTGERESAFGRRATRDPSLVRDLRRGRELSPRLIERVRATIEGTQD